MKNQILKFFFIFLALILLIIIYLSTIGIETDRFNSKIKKKISQVNNNLEVDLKKIKIKLDPLNFKIYTKTDGATLFLSKRSLPLEYVKSEFSIISLLKNKISMSNIEINTRSVLLNDFISFVRLTSNKPELFLLEQIVKQGKITLNLTLNLDEDGKVKNDYKINGLVENGNIDFLSQDKLEKVNFDFNIKKDDYIFNQINFRFKNIKFNSEKLKIKKKKDIFLINGSVNNNQSSLDNSLLNLLNLNFKNLNIKDVKFKSQNNFTLEIDNKLKINNFVLNSNLDISQLKYKRPEIVQSYISNTNELILLEDHKLNINYKKNNLIVSGEGKIQLDEEINLIKYLINKKDEDLDIKTELRINNINLKKQDFLKNYFPQMSETINFNDQKIKIDYKNKDLSFSGSGKVKVHKDYEEMDYFFEKKENSMNFNTQLNLKNTIFKIDNINYKKKDKTNMFLKMNGELKNNKNLIINNFTMTENDNKVKIINLSLNNKNQVIKIDKIDLNFLDTENIKNIIYIENQKDSNYIIKGVSLNANPLITNLLENGDKNKSNIFEKDLNIEINIDKVYFDKIHTVKKLKGKLKIKNNNVVDANILAFYNDTKNISLTIRTTDQGSKITTISSSLAKPLVSRYKFINGFKDDKDGFLDFYSSKKNGVSTSKLIIDNFKVKEIPVLAKLLALASLQGIADLLTGEGIRFTDFEMNFTNENKVMRIQELYAIGPAISILLEGYIEDDRLISLRGTLVPATTINRSIASIPLLGDLLIGKKTGEGVFGISFKIKGPYKNLETTVNPIKTLTPRFITRTLEKIKKN